MINEILENEDWKIGAFLEWRPKPKVIKCPVCIGKGVVGGGLADLDGERECPECLGSGNKTLLPNSSPPEIPLGLKEHLRRAFFDYVNKGE